MGCAARVVLFAPDAEAARTLAKAAFSRMKALEHTLSDYDPSSESELLAAGCGDGTLRPVSPDLLQVLSAARTIAQQSSGAFDPTCGALTRLWRQARRSGVPADATALRAAAATIGWKSIVLDMAGQRAALLRPGARLDFGGIAKGHAASEASRVLRNAGCDQHMVAIAGDIALGAPPPGELGWRVVPHPMQDEAQSDALWLAHCAISTSGDDFQHMDSNGKRLSHILDPRSREPLTQRVAVCVIAQEGLVADAAATALCVTPEAERAALARLLRVTALVLHERDGRMQRATLGHWPQSQPPCGSVPVGAPPDGKTPMR